MSWFKKAWHSIRSISRSPILKAVAGVAVIAFPAVGLPAVAAIAVSNKVLDAAERGDAKAKQLIRSTVAAAKDGHPEAARAVKIMKLVKAHRQGDPKARAFLAGLVAKHNRRQAIAQRVASCYSVHPQTGRLLRTKPRTPARALTVRHYA